MAARTEAIQQRRLGPVADRRTAGVHTHSELQADRIQRHSREFDRKGLRQAALKAAVLGRGQADRGGDILPSDVAVEPAGAELASHEIRSLTAKLHGIGARTSSSRHPRMVTSVA
jgi:hypothetical protein